MILFPEGTPRSVIDRAARGPREPATDPTLGMPLPATVAAKRSGTPPHRLVVIGDSLSQGFQSFAIHNTDLSFPAIIARELGWASSFRIPRYRSHGGLPLNLEYLLRALEERHGATLDWWDLPLAPFTVQSWMAEVEDYWERGPGSVTPPPAPINHNLSMFGWDLRDSLEWTFDRCAGVLDANPPSDDLLDQRVENASFRAALRVYPRATAEQRGMTLFDAARALGEQGDGSSESGIETLIVFLGANNALKAATKLEVRWSGEGFRRLSAKSRYTVWTPEHFREEYDQIIERVHRINARHVILCTVPHVTIAPITNGIGGKIGPRSRYFSHYVHPWVTESSFSSKKDKHLTGADARAIDYAIDTYNDHIESTVREARANGKDWLLLDSAAILDNVASRRFHEDPSARPQWWTGYELPGALAALDPPLTTRFLAADGQGGRAAGGLFSLDGVHPTTVGYGILAQEAINTMRAAGVPFRYPDGTPRNDPIHVDFNRLILRDTLVRHPPQNIGSTKDIIGWIDEILDLTGSSIGGGVLGTQA
ncbi:SGNH/GDSL hydrolase family protein [Lolliginicoccus levis]|uniref:SGNH/GDSL hydrolase family protein n=1 Tax=Lolliginicoccus levis TaxID=2919542 RepID=UPI00241E8DD0|nr:SGNH/GDSL hydrolase family protein [Lolliginicoccus levis]